MLELNVERSTPAAGVALRNADVSLEACDLRKRHVHFSAGILSLGCIMADLAMMGRLSTLLASARSMMTTWFCSLTFSRTQMKWSDSSVNV